ncbi:MAG: hypothetical protein JWM39_356 [Parcubacteria group bacterium]|nr:hypothetical protein [Parcubacteria group bacterium]
MLTDSHAYSGFSVNDIEKANEFYGTTLGLDVAKMPEGLKINLPGGGMTFIYLKPDHVPATFTILNFEVKDIDATADELVKAGVVLERYPSMHQDEKGIARGKAAGMGPDIAWFKDPAGNILSITHS